MKNKEQRTRREYATNNECLGRDTADGWRLTSKKVQVVFFRFAFIGAGGGGKGCEGPRGSTRGALELSDWSVQCRQFKSIEILE
jgi:hypothetical protein